MGWLSTPPGALWPGAAWPGWSVLSEVDLSKGTDRPYRQLFKFCLCARAHSSLLTLRGLSQEWF